MASLTEILEALGITIEFEVEGDDALMAKLTDDDMDRFMSGASKRKRGSESGGGKPAFKEFLKPHGLRVWALKRDLRWYMKEASKRGIAPDEAMKMLLTDE